MVGGSGTSIALVLLMKTDLGATAVIASGVMVAFVAAFHISTRLLGYITDNCISIQH